ncbi:hypothetical protein QCA50_011183 [Cerrena zonata]|uniref:Uncharacterized protein n=1 Tax=Cerrena zonata TaxID=2478898 RepID=A0AAW0G0D9_9APHY
MPSTRKRKSKAACKCNNESESYYAKNTEARRQYQNRYNKIRRLTRRKLSKHELEALRQRKADELDGVLPVFENRICRRGAGRDPECTDKMEAAERKLSEELTSLKFQLAEQYARIPCFTKENWVDAYVKELQVLRKGELSRAWRWMRFNDELKGTHEWKLEVHSRRRTVAIYHQEIHLYEQGAHIPLLASRFKELVSGGCCVNKTEFRRVYRF